MHRQKLYALTLFGCAVAILLTCAAATTLAQPSGAQYNSVDMITGMAHEGKIGNIGKISEAINEIEWGGETHLIFLIDDGLRRVFVNKHRIARFRPIEKTFERFEVWQKSTGGVTGVGFGSIVSKTPFDQFGRRQVNVRVANRVDTIYQGITEITPHYCVCETLSSDSGANIRWEMRIATSSVPIDIILSVLKR